MLRVLAHFAVALRIAQQFDPSYARVLGALHLDGRARCNEATGNLRKIFHGRSKHWNFTERRGLQNIVPAGFHQRPAHKHAVCNPVKRRQFSDTCSC